MSYDQTLQDEFINAALLDTSSPRNGAIFFSGPKAKRQAKKVVSGSNGEKKTVIETDALKEFNNQQSLYFGKDAIFSIDEAYFIGDCISEGFARDASGTVDVYIDGIKPHGTFARAEFPALLDNLDVDSFVVYDYASLKGQSNSVLQGLPMTKDEFACYITDKISGLADRRLGSRPKVEQPALA